MTKSKSARDAAERKRAAQEAALSRRRTTLRRRRMLVGGVLVAVVIAVVAWIVATSGDEGSPDASGDPTGSVVPDPALAQSRTWEVTMETNLGTIKLELDGAKAPQAVASFVFLSNQGFFDSTDCHRLTTAGIYVLQCGDPTGTGSGAPPYRFGPIENAPADDFYPAGTVAMARQPGDPSSMGSQFFIVYDDSTIASDESGGYTVFGTVTQGLDIVKSIADAGTITGGTDGRPALSVIITKVTAS